MKIIKDNKQQTVVFWVALILGYGVNQDARYTDKLDSN